jgi:hypothetical protein
MAFIRISVRGSKKPDESTFFDYVGSKGMGCPKAFVQQLRKLKPNVHYLIIQK